MLDTKSNRGHLEKAGAAFTHGATHDLLILNAINMVSNDLYDVLGM